MPTVDFLDSRSDSPVGVEEEELVGHNVRVHANARRFWRIDEAAARRCPVGVQDAACPIRFFTLVVLCFIKDKIEDFLVSAF